jgi:hypothetical protein
MKNSPTVTISSGDLVLCNNSTIEAYFTGVPSGWTAGALGGGGGPTGVSEYTLPISAGAIYVDPSAGGGGDGTEGLPYNTLRLAMDDLTEGAGGEIVIEDGTINITSANRADWLINDRASSGFSPIASGSGWAASHTDRSDMVLIRARNVHGVRFNCTGAGAYYYYCVNLEAAQYVSIDGIIFETDESWGQPTVHIVEVGSNCYITRCIAKKAADGQDGSWFSAAGSDNLFEMCYGVGAARYGFRAGGANSSEKRNVWRLCVGRHDTSTAGQPNATFAWYGNNGGNTTGFGGWFNCIALDGQFIGPGTDVSNHVRWGSWYWIKRVTDMVAKGCISLNEAYQYAAFVQANVYSGCFNTLTEDCVAWGSAGTTGTPAGADGIRNNADTLNNNVTDKWTVGKVPDAAESHGYSPLTNSRTLDTLNGTNKSIVHQADGADARFVFGQLGQRWGDTGFDAVTATPVFPFPYEAKLKEVFSEQVDTAASHTPANNVSNRGFCLDTSLTEYIIKYEDNAATTTGVYAE